VDSNGIVANAKAPIFTRPGSGDFYQGLNFHFADGQATQAGDQYMGRGLVNPDNNNFAPRLGLAYSPTNRWTLRAGIGVFYVQDTANPTFDWAATRLAATFSSPATSSAPPFSGIPGRSSAPAPVARDGPAPAW
jgi:hypothetical protein